MPETDLRTAKDIENREFAKSVRGRNVLISAAAGSGKTTTLVERITRRVMEKDVTVDRFLIVTFTKAAASDLRYKIDDSLGKMVASCAKSGDVEGAEKAYKNKILLQKTFIGTIDSFCRKVVTDNCIAAETDPSFETDDDKAAAILSEAADEILEKCYGEDNGKRDVLRELLDVYCGLNGDDELKDDIILKICENAANYPDPEGWLKFVSSQYESDNFSYFTDTIAKYIKETAERAAEHLKTVAALIEDETCPDNRKYCIKKAAEVKTNIMSYYGILTKIAEELGADSGYIFDIGIYPDFQKIISQAKSEGQKKIKSEYDKVKNYYDDTVNMLLGKTPKTVPDDYSEKRKKAFYEGITATGRYIKTLAEICIDILAAAEEKKKNRNVYGFSDIEHKALLILSNGTPDNFDISGIKPSDTAKAYGERFDEIYIDEYQDTSVMQEAILYLVSTCPAGGQNMFMVGDVKQSIYGFRKAKPEFFIKRAAAYSKDESIGVLRTLSRNFRSKPCVLESVNAVFSKIMTPEICGMSYGEDEKLVFASNKYGDISPTVFGNDDKTVVRYIHGNNLGGAGEGKYLAREIKRLVDSKMQVVDHDGKPASVKYSDIAVLAFENKALTKVSACLTSGGIPVKELTAEALFDRPEIMDVLNFLRVIDNPLQDIPVCAVMKSGFFSFTDGELAEGMVLYEEIIKQKNESRKNTFYEKLLYIKENSEAHNNCKNLCGKISAFIDTVDYFRTFALSVPLSELVPAVTHFGGYEESASTAAKGNLRILMDLASGYDRGERSGLYYFITDMTARDENEIKQGVNNGRKKVIQAFTVNGADDNKVTLTTFHKSKGLEYPVVFITGARASGNNKRHDSMVFHDRLGFSMKFVNCDVADAGIAGRKVNNAPPGCIIKYEDKLSGIAETQRVLYVAMTRAREKLYITAELPKDYAEAPFFSDEQECTATPIADTCSIAAADDIFNMLNISILAPESVRCFDTAVIEAADLESDNAGDSAEKNPAEGITGEEKQYIRLCRGTEKNDVENDKKDDGYSRLIHEIERADGGELPVKLSVSELKSYEIDETGAFARQSVSLPDIEELSMLGDIGANKDGNAGKKEQISAGTPPKLSGAAFGTLMHKFLSQLISERSRWPDNAEDAAAFAKDFAAELQSRGLFTETEAKCCDTTLAARFIASETGYAVKHAAGVYSEMPFTFKADIEKCLGAPSDTANGQKTVALQGVIDLYYTLYDGWTLIDFKTDKDFGGKHDPEKYTVQMRCYKEALESVTGKPVIKAALYYLADGTEYTYDSASNIWRQT